MRLIASRPLPHAPSPYLILAVLCVGIFVAALDQTVVYGALADMMTDLDLPVTKLDQAAWIVIGYLLGYTLAMPLMGRISDVYGHRRIYILCLGVFLMGSVLVALSNSLQWMVAARVVQAVGGGAMVPIAMAIVADIFPGRSRAISFGIIGAAVEAGAALGPFYGGALSYFLDWRWIFWINLPIGLMVILIVYLYLRPGARAKGRIDYIGAFLLAAALALLTLGLAQESGGAHFLTYTLGFAAASLLLFASFIWWETRVAEPLIELPIFKNITFSLANLINLLVGGALIMALVGIPLISETIMGRSALEAGLRLLRFTAMLAIGALIGGFLCRRFGYRLPTMLGLALSGVGFLLFRWWWGSDVAEPGMTLSLAIGGLGFGLVIAPLTTAVVDAVTAERRGIASSLVVMTRMIGMMIGLSAITAWGMGRFHLMTAGMSLSEVIHAPAELREAVLNLFGDFFLAAVVICLGGLLPALWLGRKGKPPP